MSEHLRLSRSRKTALVALTGATAFFGLKAAGGGASPDANRTKGEAKILDHEANKGFEVVNEMLVLREGVQYRKTPDVVPAETGDGSDAGSVAGKVGHGKLLVISRPFKHEDAKGNTWYGFKMNTEPSTDRHASSESIAKETYWIDMTTLNTQRDKAGNLLYDTYASGTTDTADPVVRGAFDKSGNIIIDDGSTGTLAAQATIMDAEDANFLMSNASAGRLMK